MDNYDTLHIPKLDYSYKTAESNVLKQKAKIRVNMEVIITAYRNEGKHLLEQLRGLGKFHRTVFKDVVKGCVENIETFLQKVEGMNILSISRVIPIEISLKFNPENVVEEFYKAIEPFLDRIKKGETLGVLVVRRGLKGTFSSQEVAKQIGTLITKFLERRDGERPKVSLRDPDKAIIFETLNAWCGIGIISKTMREKHFHIKLP